MKKVLLTLTVIFATSIVLTAQTTRGRVLIGGSANLNLPANDNSDRSYFRMEPRVGFFIVDNFAIGAGVPMSVSKEGNVRNSSLGLSPFGRFYVGPTNIKLFFEGRFGVEHYTRRAQMGSVEVKSSDDAIFVGLGLGGAFFLNEHVALEPQISYDARSRNNFSSSAFNFNIGFQIYIP